jgi:hypothetical protein
VAFWKQAGATLRSGWRQASLAAIVVVAIVYVLNLLLAWLQTEVAQRILAATGESATAAPGIAKTALLSQMTWHAVSLDTEIAVPQNDFTPFGASFQVSVTFAVMLGFAAAGYLLFRAGRRLAERHPAHGWLSGLRGLQIALLYGVTMFVLGLFAGVDIALSDVVPAGQGAGEGLSIRPSLLGSFGMPFLLALFAAGAGALRGKLAPAAHPARMVVAAVSGGWLAAGLAVAFASVGFLIVAALHPDATRAFLELIPGGGLSRALTVVATLLVLPNLGTGIAAASMGGSINTTSFTALGDTCALISYRSFPSGMYSSFGGGPPPDCGIPVELGPAPLPYLLFLIVPLVATIAGGRVAAQRSGSIGRREGALAGVAIAFPYAVWLWVLALIARAGYSANTGFFDLQIWIGPGLLSTVLVGLLWGAAGGAIGGALGARNASGPGITPGPPANVSG